MSEDYNDSVRFAALISVQRVMGNSGSWLQMKLEHSPLSHVSKILWASSYQESRSFHDPIEDDPALAGIFSEIKAEATILAREEFDQMLLRFGLPPGLTPDMGHCHHIWGIMQGLLKERHGIDWLTPQEMNPWLIID